MFSHRKLYDVQVNPLLNEEHPNLSIISTLHRIECDVPHVVPFVAINLSYNPITIEKGLVLGFLIPQEIDISEISTGTAQIPKWKNLMKVMTQKEVRTQM